ncbi:hypothetical protein SS50377_27459 [Spironucleus salmonicida]|uniref:Transmembrane protein n=1 Tax=Spironucleus salmonicida TaxID=348837 RepID=V6LHS8_9EUKA|nr:hypothetical protein SS50377_27459 [Spironucleus salmonicida]|eukprot:EST43251.1 Hypothetical protein SS50377_16916 [Spironucleus salmonicida]
MLCLTFQLYHDFSQQDCYSSLTELNINENHLEIQLITAEGANCDFPSGVMIVLQFQEETLNIGQFITNFSFHQSNSVIINCTDCNKYSDIQACTIILDSPQLTTVVSVGIILNVKKILQSVSQQVSLTYNGVQTCFIIQEQDVGKKLTESKILIQFVYINSSIIKITNLAPSYDMAQTSFCIMEDMQIVQLGLVSISIQGKFQGILVSQQYTTLNFTIQNQPNIFNELKFSAYKKYAYINFERIEPEFAKFVATAEFNNAVYILQVVIDGKITSFSGPLSRQIFEQNGNIICVNSFNTSLCEIILKTIQQQDMQSNKGQIFFIIGSITIRQQISQFNSDCFANVQIQLYKHRLEATYELNQQSNNLCQLVNNVKYNYDIGIFTTITEFQKGIQGLLKILSHQLIWNNSNSKIIIPYGDLQIQKIKTLLDYKSIGIIIHSIDGEYVNEALVSQVNLNFIDSYLITMFGMLVASIILATLLFIVQNMHKKPIRRKSKIKVSIDGIE